ncbi:hypothetical protein QQF64_003576 [Cirrhinus molitorella]|uniref:Integrase zinc-binding domain-containing protein n=1 Tax=Cirrhinus molitorella TaxID=172907 RepID=A0ABR3MLP9_9TELE
MQRSEQEMWAPPRPKRQVRQPSYLQDYEVGSVRPKLRPSRNVHSSPYVPSEAAHGQQSPIQWRRPPETHAEDVLDPEEGYEDISLGRRLTFNPCDERGEPNVSLSGSNSYASPYSSVRNSPLEATNRAPATEQLNPQFESWPVPPLPASEVLVKPEEKDAEINLPPPPWPSSHYPPESVVVEEHHVVTVIERMMSELQLMKDSMTSRFTAHTYPHSTQRRQNYPQPSGSSWNETKPLLQQPELYTSTSGRPLSMHPASAGPSTQSQVRPSICPPQITSREFSRNPADDVTRGKTLGELAVPNRWSQGPLFLHKAPSEWPSQPGEFLEQDTSEYKKITLCGTVSNVNREDVQEILTYQSWKDLVESVVQEAHGAADQNAPLSAEDFRQAEKTIFRRIQMECFAEELKCLRAGKAVPRSSRLIALSPELDPVEGFIRVGGRLRRAEGLDSDFKHPILLDPSHHATKLLIRGYDERLCHPGPERVFAEIRRMFWILRGREAIKREQYQCQGCQRWKSKPSVPKMADLPLARLRLYQPPFYSTGVDCFGPFPVKIGRRSEKRWGIIYKCLTTRAVHLDLLHSMDLDSFLMSLRRFVARRGSPAELYSDQGTNFRGGRRN